MEVYRIYPIGADGRIVRGYSAECETEEEAFRDAAVLIDVYPPVEVWRGPSLVRRFSAEEIKQYLRR
jgi:hypothetical protein